MAEKTRIELLNGAYVRIDEAVKAYNEAYRAKDMEAMAKAASDLSSAEADYAGQKEAIEWEAFKVTSDPVYNLLKAHDFDIIVHHDVKEKGEFIRREMAIKPRQHNLLAFCEYAGLPTDWKYTVQAYNLRLTLKTALDLGLNARQIEEINDSYRMKSLAREIEMGKTPTSNTQMCKQLQQVVDAILFEDDGKGKNKWKVNNHDVAYLVATYARKSRKALTVACATHSALLKLVCDVLYKVIEGKMYDVEYVQRKKSDEDKKVVVEAPKAAAPKVEAAVEVVEAAIEVPVEVAIEAPAEAPAASPEAAEVA